MDAHRKWLEAGTYGGISYLCSNHTKDESIFLQVMVHLYPWTLVTDNGSVFTSHEFVDFLIKNGIKHPAYGVGRWT